MLNYMKYFLNNVHVFIGYNGRFVTMNGENVYSESLVKFATELALGLSGSMKLDKTDKDIMEFLKATKCI